MTKTEYVRFEAGIQRARLWLQDRHQQPGLSLPGKNGGELEQYAGCLPFDQEFRQSGGDGEPVGSRIERVA